MQIKEKISNLANSAKLRGSILAYSLIILFMMFAIVGSLSVVSVLEKGSASSSQASSQSFQVADSGVQLAIKKINAIIDNASGNAISNAFPTGCSIIGGIPTVTGLSDAGAGSYDLSFYQDDGVTPVKKADGSPLSSCSDAQASAIKNIKSVGTYKNTVRAVNVAVASSGGTLNINSLSGSGSGNYSYAYTGSKTPIFLSVEIETPGAGNSASTVLARWLDGSGGVIKDWVTISGTNINNGPDGGSGMVDGALATIPFISGSKKIEFKRGGSNDYSMNLIAMIEQ